MPCLLIPCYDMSVANEARRPVPNEVLLPCINTYLYLIITKQTKTKENPIMNMLSYSIIIIGWYSYNSK